MDKLQPLRELALFAGAGLGLYASQIIGHKLVCAVEWDQYAQKILLERMSKGDLDNAPIWDDVQTFDGTKWIGRVDLLSAGFPCQPFSINGKVKAKNDNRNMWPDTARIIDEVQPKFVFLENVANLIYGSHGYWGEILADIHRLGFNAVWVIISAQQVGAHHQRKRVFCLCVHRRLMVDTDGARLERMRLSIRRNKEHADKCLSYWRQSPSSLYRVDDGSSNGLDVSWKERIRVLGNGQVPQQVIIAWFHLVDLAIDQGLI